ncbi:hypothetical protein P7G51_09475 [Enterococcus asini]|uniref:hypothetical protein n=1 Tax=Enterococcus asini TaxID=57732 RepID=UPI0028919D25|nr:hypothetical protein [Enterococcus asini]MDT2757607.1 hypothetical protein [Enterococcus asini]
MKGKNLVITSLLAIGLVGCTSTNSTDDTALSQSSSPISQSTTASTLPDTGSDATFASETAKIAANPDYQVDKIEVMDKNGFDWIMVRMDDSIHDLPKEEQLAICQEIHPQVLAAYEDYYADETESIHRPIVSYFTEGFDEIARTDPNASDYEHIVPADEIK